MILETLKLLRADNYKSGTKTIHEAKGLYEYPDTAKKMINYFKRKLWSNVK